MKTRSAFYILLATLLGAFFGYLFPHWGVAIGPIGDGFIRLIKMIVIPVIVSTLIVGIAGIGDIKRMGRIGIKTIVWFEIVTTIILFIGLGTANLFKPGVGINLDMLAKSDITKMAANTSVIFDWKVLLLNIIPTNIVDVLAKNDLLAVIFFCVLFGMSLVAIGEAAAPVVKFMEGCSKASFKLVVFVMRTAPIGVFALMAATVGKYGIAVLLPLAKLIGVAYIALAVVLFVLFPIIALVLKISIVQVYKMIWDLMLIGASTGSTESVLPQLMLRIEKFGVPKYITSFVIPIGMPLNSDGSVLYLCVAGMFIAQIYNVPMSFSHQMFMLMVFVITSKGVAAVPSSTMVIILAMCSVVGLPPQGVALILGVDRVIDMARTAVNVIGHVFSCTAVAKWEGVFRTEKPDEFDEFVNKLEPETI